MPHHHHVRVHRVQRHHRILKVSPLLIQDDEPHVHHVADKRLPASSNEAGARVEASKNRLTWVRPRKLVRFLSTCRLSSTYSSERSSRPVMSAAAKALDSQQMPVTEDEGRFRCRGH